MKRLCSVPGCQSGRYNDEARKRRMGLRTTSIFAVPKCNTRLQEWSKALGFAVEKTHFVCELHFADKYIKRSDDFIINGKKESIPRDHWTLLDGAVPICSYPSTSYRRNCNPMDSDTSDQQVAQNDRPVVTATPRPEAPSTMEISDAAALYEAPSNLEMQDELNEKLNASDAEVDQPIQEMPFAMENLKDHLKTIYLPRCWAWNMETSSVVFTNFNRMDYSIRAHVIISSDLSVKIRSSSGHVFDAQCRIESCKDVLMWFRTIERLPFCVGTGMDTEKRDVHCMGMLEEHEEYVRTPKSARCLHCRSLRKRLQSKPRRNLVPKLTALKAGAKSARRKYLCLQRKNEKLLADVSELHRQCAESKANCVDEAISTLPGNQREAVLACLAASKVASNGGHRYIQKISSSTYGFQQAIFECLRKKGSRMDSASKRGTLSIDEMKLSEGVSFDRRTLKFGGFVDLGEYTPETQKTSRADHALVFMFQPFRGTWVQVLGCFLTKASVPGSVLHKLMLECLILLSNSGFHVDAVTTDGAQWNRAVWKLLNISEETISAPHPCDESRRWWMISDFPHLIKCIRTAIMRLESFPTPDGVVKKDHWKALLRCENFSKPNLKVAYKLTPQHINPKGYQVMNVPLAFELFSHPVRAAMQIYEKTEPALADSASTRAFTKRIDNVITAMTARAPASALRPSEHCQNKKLSTLDVPPLFLVSSHHWNLGHQTFFSDFAVQSSDEMIDLVYLQLIRSH